MKTIKSLLLVCCMLINIGSPMLAATPNFELSQDSFIDADTIETMAQELASNENFQDLTAVMFEMSQTFRLPQFDGKSMGTKEQRLAELELIGKNSPKGKNENAKRVAELIGYEDVGVYLELKSIADRAAKKLSKATFLSLSAAPQQQVIKRAIEIALNENFFGDANNKVATAKRLTCRQCYRDFARCGAPWWQSGLLVACVAAGAAAGTFVTVTTAGTLSAAGIAAIISISGWCTLELGATNINNGCQQAYDHCLSDCNNN